MHVKAQAVPARAGRAACKPCTSSTGASPHSIVAELFTDRGVGTLVT